MKLVNIVDIIKKKKEKIMIVTLVKAILAGILIGMGGTVYLNNPGPLGAFLFALGLFVICTRAYNLFTGKVGYSLDKSIAKSLPVIWIGNFIGTFIVAMAIKYSCSQLSTEGLVIAKITSPYLVMFIKGVFCGILMFLAVDTYKKQGANIFGLFGIVIPVAVFILSGFNHCIADMFYISMHKWSLDAFIYIAIVTLGNSVGGLLLPVLEKIKEN